MKEVFQDDRQRRVTDDIPANEVGIYDCLFVKKAKENDDLICNPIYEWTDSEVWEFIQDRKMKYNPLYDMGYSRVGCIGCPLSSEQVKELEMYPKYKQNYINAFERMLNKRKAKGKNDKSNWKNGEAVYKWWIGDDTIDGQMDIYDFIKKEDE